MDYKAYAIELESEFSRLRDSYDNVFNMLKTLYNALDCEGNYHVPYMEMQSILDSAHAYVEMSAGYQDYRKPDSYNTDD